MRKKAQMTIGNAPVIALIVGLTFLVMATVALLGQRYGEAIPSTHTVIVSNESATLKEPGQYISNYAACNFKDFTVIEMINQTDLAVIDSGDYSSNSYGFIVNATTDEYALVNVSYSYNYAGVACDINKELETEISNNTPIAGIVLTISLVGIVLAILISAFMGMRRTRV